VLLFVVPTLASAANAAELAVAVQDREGQPIEDAVVYAQPIAPQSASVPPNQPAIIDQIDKEYVPYVTAVQVGTAISFPNRDQIRHHVYSFSDAKTFEIPLYEGTPTDPVVFDTPGAVTLGCNIHDWMKAYVFVTESPFFAVTAAGGDATIELPAGGYEVEVWHPELKGEPASLTQRISVDGERASLSFSIERRHVWTPRRAPSRDGAGGYR
jgi:plastocyanin